MGYEDHLFHNYEGYIKGILPSESFPTLNITECVRRRKGGFSPPKLSFCSLFCTLFVHTLLSVRRLEQSHSYCFTTVKMDTEEEISLKSSQVGSKCRRP